MGAKDSASAREQEARVKREASSAMPIQVASDRTSTCHRRIGQSGGFNQSIVR
jgi:hypothetical protein